jgi:hypothetical protein
VSDWNASQLDAKWYGEVVFGWTLPDGGTETDYNYGYSSNESEPDPRQMSPDGVEYEILEYSVFRVKRSDHEAEDHQL